MFDPATLSVGHATVISAFVTASYVGGIYLTPSARISFAKTVRNVPWNGERRPQAGERSRDNEEVIKARLRAVSVSTFVSCCVVYACVARGHKNDERWTTAVKPAPQLLGLSLPSMNFKSVVPHLMTPILYMGPLTAHFISGTLPLQRNWSYAADFRPMFATWIGVRNFIIAPITEELVFRSCLLALAGMSGRSTSHKLFVTPLWFGLAHLHHAYELYHKFGSTRAALVRAVITCLVQFTYTTIFGAYTAYLLLRTNSILPSITAHVTANILGLPQPAYELQEHPHRKSVISVAYLVGIAGFVYILLSGTL